MIWNNFKDLFHPSWWEKIKPFIESEECDKIYKFLKEESGRGKKIAPLSSNTFRCFKETSLDELKVILVGMCPYHSLKDGKPIADGLLMGCSNTGYPQPSLEQFYTAIENELYKGLNLRYFKNPDVSYLANKGVLMLNAALTTEIGLAGAHQGLWKPFMKYLFSHLATGGTPIILMGEKAAEVEEFIDPYSWVFKVSHPASASYRKTQWNSEGVFTLTNRVLKETNNISITWLDEEEDNLPF